VGDFQPKHTSSALHEAPSLAVCLLACISHTLTHTLTHTHTHFVCETRQARDPLSLFPCPGTKTKPAASAVNCDCPKHPQPYMRGATGSGGSVLRDRAPFSVREIFFVWLQLRTCYFRLISVRLSHEGGLVGVTQHGILASLCAGYRVLHKAYSMLRHVDCVPCSHSFHFYTVELLALPFSHSTPPWSNGSCIAG
jgi:hypothetical protein